MTGHRTHQFLLITTLTSVLIQKEIYAEENYSAQSEAEQTFILSQTTDNNAIVNQFEKLES